MKIDRTSRYSALAVVALVAIAVARIAATYGSLNQAYDEPAHIACGIELLQSYSYRLEPQHPPLARISAAVLPFLSGSRLPASGALTELQPSPDPIRFDWVRFNQLGNFILTVRGSYTRTLALARLGILPSYILACCVVWWWASELFSPGTALICLLLYSNLPPVLAHAGLATTDMAFAAMLAAALFSFFRLVRSPTRSRLLLCAILTGAAIATKITACIYLPVSYVGFGLYVLRERKLLELRFFRTLAAPAALFCIVAALTLSAGYLFKMDRFYNSQEVEEKHSLLAAE